MSGVSSLERAVLLASLVNAALGAAIGALANGLSGAMIGVVLGLALAVAPLVMRAALAWLGAPRGLPRFVAGEVSRAAVAGGRSVLNAILGVLTPFSGVLTLPLLLLRFAFDVVRRAMQAGLSGLWRLVANPLGLANLAALGIIAVSLSGLEFAGPVAVLGLGMLVLVLPVTVDEAAEGPSATPPPADR